MRAVVDDAKRIANEFVGEDYKIKIFLHLNNHSPKICRLINGENGPDMEFNIMSKSMVNQMASVLNFSRQLDQKLHKYFLM